MGLDVRLEILTTLYSETTDKPNLHPCSNKIFCSPVRSLNLSTNSTVFAIDPLTEHAKDENKKAPDMKTTFSKKKKKKRRGVIAKPEGQKGLPFSAAHLRNHLSTK